MDAARYLSELNTYQSGTVWKGYAAANPNEARDLDAYLRSLATATPLPLPTPRTKAGHLGNVIAAVLASAPTPPPPPPPPSTPRLWPDTAWPNIRAQDHWQPLSNSAQLVALFTADAPNGVWSNGLSGMGGAWSTTMYHVADATTTRVVQQKIFGGSVTIPWNPTWHPSPDSDGHCVIVNADLSYTEFEGLDQPWTGGYGWCAGAAFGDFTAADAIPIPKTRHISGATLPAGLILPQEVEAGVIPHATKGSTVSTMSKSLAGCSVYPAWGSDGSHNPGIPMGQWFALPANFDSSPYSGIVKAVAECWKTYGHYITDTGGSANIEFLSSSQAGVTYPFASLTIPPSIVKSLIALTPSKASY